MKTLLLIIAFPAALFAQAPYKGGLGDGHAMTETKNIVVQSVSDLKNPAISISPNPAIAGNDIIIKDNTNEQGILTVYSIDGKPVINIEGTKEYKLQTSGMPAGIYFVELRTSGSKRIQKIIIQ